MIALLKRILAYIIDVLFFLGCVGSALAAAIVIIYLQSHDISVINELLQTSLTWTMIGVYAGLVAIYFFYYWILPVFFKGTVGQALFKLSFVPQEKVNLISVFFKNIAGMFWDVLLFPYTVFAWVTKRATISTKMSGLSIADRQDKMKLPFYLVLGLMVIYLLATIGMGIYVYQTGVPTLMERYTDYGKQVATLIDKEAFQDAEASLVKYKQYQGETNDYWFSSCIIQGNLGTEQTTLDLCSTALEKNKGNVAREQQITVIQGRIQATNGNFAEAEVLYAKLWNDYMVRTLDMKDYVAVLSEVGKTKEASAVLTEIAKNVPADNYSVSKDIADLYERLGNPDLALTKYHEILASIPEGTNVDIAGELHYNIGVALYKKGKNADAKAEFEKARTMNPDFAEASDSYLIILNKLLKSIVK